MVTSSSLTNSQVFLGRTTISHSDLLAFPSFRLSTLAGRGIKSQSLRVASSRKGVSSRSSIRAEAVENLDKTEMSLLEKSINTIRLLAIDAVEKANSRHLDLPMGCAPMGHILYDEVMKYNPKNPIGSTVTASCSLLGMVACYSMLCFILLDSTV